MILYSKQLTTPGICDQFG